VVFVLAPIALSVGGRCDLHERYAKGERSREDRSNGKPTSNRRSEKGATMDRNIIGGKKDRLVGKLQQKSGYAAGVMIFAVSRGEGGC
jgi:hypothetical protein